MANTTYLKTILIYFQTMDIEMLRLHLKDEYSYQNTTKEIFLDKLQGVFEDYKNSGETILLMRKGECISESSVCKNCGKSGYRFIGNNKGVYIDFIFEIEGDDIKDIYDCSTFETHKKTEHSGFQAYIYINQDDKITFN